MPTIEELNKAAAKEEPETFRLPDTLASMDASLLGALKPLPRPRSKDDSANALVQNLAVHFNSWKETLPAHTQVGVYVMVLGMGWRRVVSIAAMGHHGVALELEDGSISLIHQSNLQLICRIEKVDDESPRREIGFIVTNSANPAQSQ
jgi:hypothetical protein